MPTFTFADIPALVARGMVSQADADRVMGKPTPAAETVRKASAQARAETNAALELVAQDELTRQLATFGVPSPVWDRVGNRRKFSDAGNWRFDGRIDDRKIAIEIDGGTRRKSRHTSPLGFARDCEKTNEAQLLGWRIFRFTYRMIHDGRAAETIRRAYQGGTDERTELMGWSTCSCDCTCPYMAEDGECCGLCRRGEHHGWTSSVFDEERADDVRDVSDGDQD